MFNCSKATIRNYIKVFDLKIKEKKMKNLIRGLTLLFIYITGVLLGLGIISICEGAPLSLGTVKDNNNGNKGYIFIHSGDIQGKYNDVGTWVDIKEVPELKGDKGEQGIAGKDGYTPVKGVDYFDGKDGLNGEKAKKEIQGLKEIKEKMD